MNIIKCENGHFFDADKNKHCPQCEALHVLHEGEQSDKHSVLENILFSSQKKIATKESKQKNPIYPVFSQSKPVGWLTCIKGDLYGEFFVVREGRNSVGRNGNMNICLHRDPNVEKENHLLILYDEKNGCVIHPNHEVSVNDKKITEAYMLQHLDIVKIGNGLYIYTALCQDSFYWSLYKE